MESSRPQHPRPPHQSVWRGLVVLLVAGVVAILVGCNTIPVQHRPWGDLDLNAPVGLFTGTQLADLRNEPGRCIDTLQASEVEFTRIEDRVLGEFCAFRGAVALDRSVTPYSAPVRVTCALAAALYLWEREVLQPTALELFGAQVERIEHAGTYACRRVNNSSSGRPSEHATANAIDVTGFLLDDGRRVTVLADWNGGSSEARFLRRLHEGGCDLFRGVLGPDYNQLHADHFHLDMGSYSLCR